MLKLNDDKTEFIMFKPKRNVKAFVEKSIHVGCTAVEISSKFKNIEVIIIRH